MSNTECTLIIGITSGIGSALSHHLFSIGNNIVGTSRIQKPESENLIRIFELDISSLESISSFVELFTSEYVWERIVFCPAVMSPIGPFRSVDITQWVSTFNVNFSNQVYLLHKILPFSHGQFPHVLFFAGGGTNSAPKNYSAYTLSKIALIKLVELLDKEIDNITFSILGPGWVNTKIHEQSLAPELSHLPSFKETEKRLLNSDFVGMEQVISSIMWIFSQEKAVVGGRNFSAAHDPFDSVEFRNLLSSNVDLLKLRRHGNHLSQSQS